MGGCRQAGKGLALRDIAQPKPKPNEVLVRVRAAALNRADLATARGVPHGSHGGIGAAVGLEWAGEVVETGAKVTGYKPGERVMCSGTGGYAEYAVTDWRRVNPIPEGMSFEQAATLPVALLTLHNALVTAGRLKPGESVMIQGASSGVGLMGLQIAKIMGAKLVIGSSTNDVRRARLRILAPTSPSTPAMRPGPTRYWPPPAAKASISSSTCYRDRSLPRR